MSFTPAMLTATLWRQQRHSVARLWLAGFLVGCLLPVNLHPADSLRNSDRGVSICFWVPAVLRMQSQWVVKKRRALRDWARLFTYQLALPPASIQVLWQVARRLVAAKDVLTQRGPPQESEYSR